MIFYSFYTDRFRDPSNLVYRTNTGQSELQVDLKMFDSESLAQLDFFKLLYDNEDLRIGEYFDTDKGKKSTKKKVEKKSNETPIYSVIPPDYRLELDKVYNLDCNLFMNTVPDKYIDYIFTSPPYNITKQIGGGDLYDQYEDNLTPEEYLQWLCDIVREGLRITKKHIFFNIQQLARNKKSVIELMYHFREYVKDVAIWNKSVAPPHIQPGVMNSKFEYVIVFSNDRPETKVFSDARWSQGTFNNVIEGLNASRNKYAHLNKATFPLYLPRIFMQNFGKKADIWYDPFTGTGTTFHSAVIEERHFLGTEIDANQCEAANKRIFIEESALKFDFPYDEPDFGIQPIVNE